MSQDPVKTMAVALDATGGLQRDHFGQAYRYAICSAQGKVLEMRENPFFGRHEHAKAEEILGVLPDCFVWVGVAMGKRSREYLMQKGIRTILVSEGNSIEEVFQKITKEKENAVD